MKKLFAALCLMASTTCLAQSPGAKILVLDREQGERRVRRPREKMPNPTSEFILKVTPQNSGSQHLVLGTETIPPGGVIPKHRHLGQDEILFLQTGSAHVSLNDQDYEVHAGGMVFFPLNTWVSLRNTGTAPIQLIFIFSAPGFDEYMRCSSVPKGQPAPPIRLDQVSKCAHEVMSSTKHSLVQRVSKDDANRAGHRSAQQAVASQNIESMVPERLAYMEK